MKLALQIIGGLLVVAIVGTAFVMGLDWVLERLL
jgi:hypothetical protein